MKQPLILATLLISLLLLPACGGTGPELADQASASIKRAATYLRGTVSTEGGYLWSYSLDLSERAGEGEARAGQVWVQPPGTPSAGFAFLRAYQVTGDKTYLGYALDAGKALAWGQLASGGWGYRIDFNPEADERYYYRREAEAGKAKEDRETNDSTFDDNNTQLAIRLLLVLDYLTHDPEVHKAALAGLELMAGSQFPNGAWPQRYPLPDDYGRWYTFNDNCINDCIQVLLDAHAICGEKRYLDSALKGGDFILLSQYPKPQAGWAQQYDYDMKAVWARKYEPPGVNARVTAYNIKTLVQLYLVSGEARFLEAIPAAIDWLEASRIGPDLWARFYEVDTNRPLYMDSGYKLVYTDFDTPTHYSFKGRYDIPDAIDLYNRVKLGGREVAGPSDIGSRTKAWALENRVKAIISAQDDQGRWVSNGGISMQEFLANILALSEYIATVSGRLAIKDIPVELTDVPIDLLVRPWRIEASSGE